MLSPIFYLYYIDLFLYLCHIGKGSCDLTVVCVVEGLLTLHCVFSIFSSVFHFFLIFMTRIYSFSLIFEHLNLHLDMYRIDYLLAQFSQYLRKYESCVALMCYSGSVMYEWVCVCAIFSH